MCNITINEGKEVWSKVPKTLLCVLFVAVGFLAMMPRLLTKQYRYSQKGREVIHSPNNLMVHLGGGLTDQLPLK